MPCRRAKPIAPVIGTARNSTSFGHWRPVTNLPSGDTTIQRRSLRRPRTSTSESWTGTGAHDFTGWIQSDETRMATSTLLLEAGSSPEALREKAVYVLGRMESRMAAFGAGWADTTGTQVYCVRDIHPFLGDEIARRGAARAGLAWHYDRPPVIGLDYEMDCRSVAVERAL